MVDATTEHFVFQLTGRTDKVEQFIAIMAPLGLVEDLPHGQRRAQPRSGGSGRLSATRDWMLTGIACRLPLAKPSVALIATMPCHLSVNLNAIAMLRNRRNLPWPSVVGMGRIAL